MDQLIELDKELFLYLNSLHTLWLDPVMFWLTKTIVWLPLYLFLLYIIYKNYKTKSWIVFIGIAITIFLADQITSGFMKPFFERLRPSREPSLEGMVHLVNGYKGGMYGFASSHAANTFGIAAFLSLLFHKKYAWINWIFGWSFITGYTRIYLGVHYPGDILVGGIIGIICGWIMFKMFREVENIRL